MFFPKKPARKDHLDYWDDKTTERLAELESFEVAITSATKRYGFGGTERGPIREPSGFDITGLLTFPRYIPVNFTFYTLGADEGKFGGWLYSVWDGVPQESHRIPFIEIWVYDSRLEIGQALYDAHRTALASGRRRSNARFWKRRGEGVMTAKDKEQGYSYQSRYDLIGMYTWAVSQASRLPPWAVPYASEGFSAEHVPSPMEMMEALK